METHSSPAVTFPGTAHCSAGKNGPNSIYDWWTVLEPHLTKSCKKETTAVRQQARKDLEDENKAMPAIIRQIRGGGQ